MCRMIRFDSSSRAPIQHSRQASLRMHNHKRRRTNGIAKWASYSINKNDCSQLLWIRDDTTICPAEWEIWVCEWLWLIGEERRFSRSRNFSQDAKIKFNFRGAPGGDRRGAPSSANRSAASSSKKPAESPKKEGKSKSSLFSFGKKPAKSPTSPPPVGKWVEIFVVLN